MADLPLNLRQYFKSTEVLKILNGMKKKQSAPIKTVFYLKDSRYGLSEIIDSWVPDNFNFKDYDLIYNDDDVNIYSFNIIPNDSLKRECPHCKNTFFDYELSSDDDVHPELYVLELKGLPFFMVISNSFYKESNKEFSFFDKYYPFFSRLYIKSHILKMLIEKYQDTYKGDLKVIEYILKRYFDGKATERTYEECLFDTVIKRAINSRMWLDNITFKIDLGKIQISRSGKIQFYDDITFSDMLPMFGTLISLFEPIFNIMTFDNDSSQFNSSKIILSEDIFQDSNNISEFISYLNKIENSSVSIISRNNGFAELTFLDYFSGASFDLYLYSTSEIIIVPRFEVTNVVYSKFINYIMEDYDGRIEKK